MNRRLLAVGWCLGCLWAGISAQPGACAPAGPGQPHAVIAFGTEVDRGERALVGTSETFPAGIGKVFCLARVVGAEPPTTANFVWYYQGRTMARVELPIRSGDFRTWSSKNIMPAWVGEWNVKVLDPDGMVLGEGSFTVSEQGVHAH